MLLEHPDVRDHAVRSTAFTMCTRSVPRRSRRSGPPSRQRCGRSCARRPRSHAVAVAVMSTSTPAMGSGGQSGHQVRRLLTAMNRRTIRGCRYLSLGQRPVEDPLDDVGAGHQRGRGRGERAVTSLSDTSTMCAVPSARTCESSASRTPFGGRRSSEAQTVSGSPGSTESRCRGTWDEVGAAARCPSRCELGPPRSAHARRRPGRGGPGACRRVSSPTRRPGSSAVGRSGAPTRAASAGRRKHLERHEGGHGLPGNATTGTRRPARSTSPRAWGLAGCIATGVTASPRGSST